nr:NUDIX hydrolase [Pseudonocardia sp. ICBG601]
MTRVRRLHRLHVRVDAARAGLAAALDARARVALSPSPTRSVPRAPPELRRAAVAARARCPPRAGRPRPGREPRRPRGRGERPDQAARRRPAGAGEPAPCGDLAEAEALVVLARRVHNDAVRDTRALRSRRLVRMLRLYGTAPEPVYFEIADPEPPRSPARPHVESRRSPTVM